MILSNKRKTKALIRLRGCTLQKDTKNENLNYIVLKCILLLCTRSELDILLLHVLDWTNI